MRDCRDCLFAKVIGTRGQRLVACAKGGFRSPGAKPGLVYCYDSLERFMVTSHHRRAGKCAHFEDTEPPGTGNKKMLWWDRGVGSDYPQKGTRGQRKRRNRTGDKAPIAQARMEARPNKGVPED